MGTKTTVRLVAMLKQYRIPLAYISGSQSVFRGPWVREQLPGDPWIHFCTGYFEVYLFLYSKNKILLKTIQELV
jgi:hypothetical protein